MWLVPQPQADRVEGPRSSPPEPAEGGAAAFDPFGGDDDVHVLTPAQDLAGDASARDLAAGDAAARDVAARDLASRARLTLDEHWAVSAIQAERRTLLLERAEAASLRPGDGLGEPIADGLALLGTAYELAALSHLEVALQPVQSAGRDLAQAVLALGAARSFRCSAALRPPLRE